MQEKLDNLTPIADKILLLLKRGKFTRKALATHLGVSENGLKLMFDKDSYKHETLKGIADFLRVEVSDLINQTKVGLEAISENKQINIPMEQTTQLKVVELLERLVKSHESEIEHLKSEVRTLKNSGEVDALRLAVKRMEEEIKAKDELLRIAKREPMDIPATAKKRD